MGAMVCMELVETTAAGRGLTPSNNDDRQHLDPLVKRINDNTRFGAEDFRRNGNIGTLVGEIGGDRNRNNHYRIDSQIASRDRANIQYQVGDRSKAKCLIQYLPDGPIPAGFPANTRLTQHFSDEVIKAMVQDGLDIGVLRRAPRETQIQWRVVQVPVRRFRNSYKLPRADVRTALRREYSARGYSQNIMEQQFEVLRVANGRERIIFSPRFQSQLYWGQ